MAPRHLHKRFEPCGKWVWLIVVAVLAVYGPASAAEKTSNGGSIDITDLPPDPRGGRAYRLTYVVGVPIDIYWRFKTDFDNTYVESNRYILSHRMISRNDNLVITEDRYSNLPDVVFRWQTNVFPEKRRLEYKVISTNQSGYKFHYGFIQIEAKGENTLVTQEAYFDFFGASLWSIYPWSGGMRSFLEYTARWEQQTAVRLRHVFDDPGGNTETN